MFDFGGVLITPITNQLSVLAREHGVDPVTMKRVLLGPPESGDHPWHRAERGDLPVAEIQAELNPWAAAEGVRTRGDEIESLLAAGQYTIIDSMRQRARDLRDDGIRVGLLTNTFAEFRPTMDRDIDLASFDVVVESFAVGARKPEPAIYDAVEVALGLAGPAIVYLDDFAENLVPAAARGWDTILVADPAAALDELDRRFVD